MSKPWDAFLTERDKAVFAAGGFGQRAGFGKRPAVIVVDVNYNFVGDKPAPILESIKEWSHSCGEEGWAGVHAIARILAAARPKGVPVIYTKRESMPAAGPGRTRAPSTISRRSNSATPSSLRSRRSRRT